MVAAGARREASEQWTHDLPSGMPRHLCGVAWSLREGSWPGDAGRDRPYHDVLTAGSGARYSKAVTRCSSALTGQELGRWRRIRSLYCLTWVATLKRLRITVEG